MHVPKGKDEDCHRPTADTGLAYYEISPFVERLTQSLTLDRDAQNSLADFKFQAFETAMTSKQEPILGAIARTQYRTFRSLNSWHVKRQVNAILVESTWAHKHVIDLSRPVILDILMSRRPTARDWKAFTEIGVEANEQGNKPKIWEKSVQRTKKHYPNVVGSDRGPTVFVRKEDGTIEAYPRRPNREDQRRKDRRLENIATHYSLEPWRGSLDAKDFADANFVRRLRKYWRDLLRVLAETLEKHGPIRPEMEWVIYQIVNCDFLTVILFDDLSEEYEARWFENELSDENKMQIAGLPGLQSEPHFFTKQDAKDGVAELWRFIEEFDAYEMPAILLKYRISWSVLKTRILQCALAAADDYVASGNPQPATFIIEEILGQGLAESILDRQICAIKLALVQAMICHYFLVEEKDPATAWLYLQDSRNALAKALMKSRNEGEVGSGIKFAFSIFQSEI